MQDVNQYFRKKCYLELISFFFFHSSISLWPFSNFFDSHVAICNYMHISQENYKKYKDLRNLIRIPSMKTKRKRGQIAACKKK